MRREKGDYGRENQREMIRNSTGEEVIYMCVCVCFCNKKSIYIFECNLLIVGVMCTPLVRNRSIFLKFVYFIR